MAIKLTKKQQRYLKALAHHLNPLSLVGKAGLSDEFLGQVRQTLFDHELVKVKFNEFKEEKKVLSKQLAEKLDAALVGMTGNVLILYVPQKVEKLRRITLPE